MNAKADLVRVETLNRVATLTMNNPRRLNGWTLAMQEALADAFADAARRNDVAAVVLTGTGEYYSAGVDLGGSLRFDHPKKLRALIEEKNYALFDLFIQFPKPILAAINGKAIGAPVTSATLCDAMIAAEPASFSTPFAKVGLPPEGCSSIHFERLMGPEAAARMLGPDGWRPTATEAAEVGLVDKVVPADALMTEARAISEGWVADGKRRTYRGGSTKAELMKANAEESKGVADGFFSGEFLMNQYRFLKTRSKLGPAYTFLGLRLTRPVWSLLL